MKRKIVVSISGASGANLGLKLYEHIPSNIQKHLIMTDSSKKVLELEDHIHYENEIEANISSGSYGCDAMAIVPCSMNTLAKIACGIADNLTTRVAAVIMKEKKKLLIATREMPFTQISLENMLKLSKIEGVIIAPPLVATYSDQKSCEDMYTYLVGRWLDLLNIENNLYKRWE